MATAAATLALCSSLNSKCRVSSSCKNSFAATSFNFCHSPLKQSLGILSKTATFLPKAVESASAPPLLENEPQSDNIVAAQDETSNREQIFAVVMIGSRQYIVIPGRFLYIQRLKDAKVNDKVTLNKVLLVGTKSTTYIGRPIVTNATVHAVVEEQGLDDKVIVFKYKKKKKYRRNIGHRQPNTRIRITGISGFEDYPATPNAQPQ